MMSLLQPLIALGPRTYYEPFQSPWDYADGTLLDDATSLFTRQYPATSSDNIEYSSASTRAQLVGNGNSDSFSWDEPGETDGDFTYSALIIGSSATDFVWQLFFCWTPDSGKANQGTGYAMRWDGVNGDLVFREYASGTPTDNVTQSFTMQTGYSYEAEIIYVQSTGAIDLRLWRTIDSRPSTATISTSDASLSSGKVGFFIYKGASGAGTWIDELKIVH